MHILAQIRSNMKTKSKSNTKYIYILKITYKISKSL